MRRLILCALLVCAVRGAEPAFDTVSITPNRSGSSGYSTKLQSLPEPVTLTMRNASLKLCVQLAYGVKEYQVSGPKWINSTRFDISATLPAKVSPEQVWPALRALLAERLKLSVRDETKELAAYGLTVAETGAKLHPAGASEPQDIITGSPTSNVRLTNSSIDKFCDLLSHRTDRPVVDATGIPGAFDFDLRYDKRSGPSLSSALQRQFGLKLDPRKQAVQMVVVESALRVPIVSAP